MATLKDYCVVTINLVTGDDWHVHSYGPYTQKEAARMKGRLGRGSTVAFMRKLLDRNEVTAKPATPKG